LTQGNWEERLLSFPITNWQLPIIRTAPLPKSRWIPQNLFGGVPESASFHMH